jgi:hypothetical protein
MDDDAAARLRWEDDEIDDSDDGLRELATKFTREEMELAEQAAAAKPRSAAAAAAREKGGSFRNRRRLVRAHSPRAREIDAGRPRSLREGKPRVSLLGEAPMCKEQTFCNV